MERATRRSPSPLDAKMRRNEALSRERVPPQGESAMGRADWGIGIIGLGNIAQQHLVAYQARGLRVVGGAEPDEGRRCRAGEIFGIPTFADYHELLDQPACRIVDVTVPHRMELREPIVRDAADRGKALLVQKPLMPHLEDAPGSPLLLPDREPQLGGYERAPLVRQGGAVPY
jgi:Oxidoreductase family, NAD-binding Rossmann fold